MSTSDWIWDTAIWSIVVLNLVSISYNIRASNNWKKARRLNELARLRRAVQPEEPAETGGETLSREIRD